MLHSIAQKLTSMISTHSSALNQNRTAEMSVYRKLILILLGGQHISPHKNIEEQNAQNVHNFKNMHTIFFQVVTNYKM